MHMLKVFSFLWVCFGLAFAGTVEKEGGDHHPHRLVHGLKERIPFDNPQTPGTYYLLSLGVKDEADFRKMKIAFTQKLFNQAAVLAMWGGNRADTPQETQRLLQRMDGWRTRAQKGQTSWYGVYAQQAEGEDRFLGAVGGYRYPNDAATAPFDGAVEIVWNIVPGAWGKGYGTSAVRAFMAEVVADIHDYRYAYASAKAENERSIRLAQSLGMTKWDIPEDMGKRPSHLDRDGKPIFKIDRVVLAAQRRDEPL